MDDIKPHHHDFIRSAFSDVTETIRFMDAKAGAVFVLHGIVISIALAARESLYQAIRVIFEFSLCCGILFILLMVIALVLLLISALYLMFTIKQRINPSEAVPNELPKENLQMWFITNSNEKSEGKIATSLEDYYKNLLTQSECAILKLEIFELLKVSFIRNKKMVHFDKAFSFFMWSTLLMVVIAVLTIIVNFI